MVRQMRRVLFRCWFRGADDPCVDTPTTSSYVTKSRRAIPKGARNSKGEETLNLVIIIVSCRPLRISTCKILSNIVWTLQVLISYENREFIEHFQ
jgi:hypothetical protein